MKISDARAVLRECVRAAENGVPGGLPTLLTGPPGVGKTAIARQVASELGADLVVFTPALGDQTEVKGLPFAHPGDTEATFLPYGDFQRLFSATKLTVALLEDLGQATPAVQAAWMQPLEAREVFGRKIPDCVVFVATTNRRQDSAGVTGLLEPVKSRFKTIVEVEVSPTEWAVWALEQGWVPADLIAFVRAEGEDWLHRFVPSRDMVNSPCPRTWAAAARVMGLPNLTDDQRFETVAGAVGRDGALQYWTFRRLVASLPVVREFLADPDGTPLPRSVSEIYAVCTALALQASVSTAAALATIATRLAEAQRGEFAVLLVRDAVRKDREVEQTAAWVTLYAGPVGDLLAL